VRQKLGPTKTFFVSTSRNSVSYPFCLDCWFKHVCLKCLWKKFVNQQNPCALLIIPLENATSYFLTALSWQPLLFSNDLTFSKNKEPRFILTTKAFLNYVFIKLMGIYRLVWSHYFTILLFYKPLASGFQTPLRKLVNGDVYVSICFWKYFPKPCFLIWNSIQTSPWHDHYWAHVQPLYLRMLD
jgi:hypothetical protein